MSTDLPWDRWGPGPEAEKELPYHEVPDYTPPAPDPLPPLDHAPPAGVSGPDWGDVLDEAWPVIRDQVVDYAKGVVGAVVSGQTVDVVHPTVTAVTAEGRELVVADAKSRSWRTLIQGLIFDVIAAVIAAIAFLSGADPFVKETWITFGILLLKSVISAVISYFMRLRVTPTIRTEGEKMNVVPLAVPIPGAA